VKRSTAIFGAPHCMAKKKASRASARDAFTVALL